MKTIATKTLGGHHPYNFYNKPELVLLEHKCFQIIEIKFKSTIGEWGHGGDMGGQVVRLG